MSSESSEGVSSFCAGSEMVLVEQGCQAGNTPPAASCGLACLPPDLLNSLSPETDRRVAKSASQNCSHRRSCRAGLRVLLIHPRVTSPAPLRLRAGHHLVHPEGVVAPLPAVLMQLADVRQGIQGATKIRLPRLGVRFVFSWTVAS